MTCWEGLAAAAAGDETAAVALRAHLTAPLMLATLSRVCSHLPSPRASALADAMLQQLVACQAPPALVHSVVTALSQLCQARCADAEAARALTREWVARVVCSCEERLHDVIRRCMATPAPEAGLEEGAGCWGSLLSLDRVLHTLGEVALVGLDRTGAPLTALPESVRARRAASRLPH